MTGQCFRDKKHAGGVPDPDCTCGIYATTDLEVVNDYLGDEAPVLGIVELGGRTIPATQGYRAEAARARGAPSHRRDFYCRARCLNRDR